MPERGPLSGCRIVVPESRALDVFVAMIERQGGTALRCPLVSIHDTQDPAPVLAWLERLAAGGLDDVVFFTGEGVARLAGFARRAGREEAVVAALRAIRKIVRGPKPVAALRRLGLAPDLSAEAPTSAGLVATLSTLDLAGRRVGVQLYPDAASTVVDFLAERGAHPDPVLCYRYASDEEDGRVATMIRRMEGGEVDMIAFTSSPQIRRLRSVARSAGLDEVLERAMRRVTVAAVGPVAAEAVAAAGWPVGIVPNGSFHLKPLVASIGEALAFAHAKDAE